MNKTKLIIGASITIAGIAVIAVIGFVICVIMYFSYNNQAVGLANQIQAKQLDNTSQLDNTIKVISQNAQITREQRDAIKDIIVGNAQARSAKGGSLATLVHEAVPNVDTETYRQLMNTVTAARNKWTEDQRQLIDIDRAYNNLLTMQPSAFFVSTLGGKQPIKIIIVTSTRTQDSFNTGRDDDTELFKK